MSDANDNEGRPAGPRAPLTLKPRVGGSVASGTVKQSFSHGRSKTVVVETKRRRFDTPGPTPAERHPAFEVKRPAPAQPAAPRPAAPVQDAGGLSAEEAARRQRAVEAAREAQE